MNQPLQQRPTDPPTEETFAASLTPAGRSAIAVVLVRGPAAEAAVDSSFAAANGQPLTAQPADAIRFGRWGGAQGEELVVCRRSTAVDAPGEVEVHCHGGRAAVAAVLADLATHGCRVVDWREIAGATAPNPIAVESRAALADALTERAAGVLLDQLGGALEREARSAIAALEGGDPSRARTIVDGLLDRSAVGLHLATPWRVAIVGPPNVGKSRLMNALLGYKRAIVYDQPGVTRDVVTATTAVDGWPVTLLDTAGLRAAEDDLEVAGVELARATLATADLAILAAEAGPEVDHAWRLIGDDLPAGCEKLCVATKSDLLTEGTPLPGGALITSAATGEGIASLLAAIGDRLAPLPPAAGAGVPFLDRHVSLLSEAAEALRTGAAAAARSALHSLLC